MRRPPIDPATPKRSGRKAVQPGKSDKLAVRKKLSDMTPEEYLQLARDAKRELKETKRPWLG
jgi:hypothetical protein